MRTIRRLRPTLILGLDFVEVVHEAVGSCDALIAVIGGEWLGASDESGRRRLENPDDLVKLEKALARRNSVEVSDNRFRTDTDQLIEALEVPTAERLADTVFFEPAQL